MSAINIDPYPTEFRLLQGKFLNCIAEELHELKIIILVLDTLKTAPTHLLENV